MNDLTQAYAAEIVKLDKTEDGDLIVFGKATGPELDLDEQSCDPAWLSKAMPRWMEYGNIREMHQPVVAGLGMELVEDQDQYYLKSRCIDPVVAKKLEAGAYKGYSIGIKNARVVKDATAPNGRIVGGDIVEISYVDRPCNPTATLALAKRASADEFLLPESRPDELTEDADKSVTVVLDGEDAGGAEPGESKPEPGEVSSIVLSAEKREEAIQIVKAVNAQGAVDEAPDIDGAEHALQIIAKLIQYEAQEMAIGEFGETCDIGLLMEAASALKYFLSREKASDASPADGELTTAYLAAEADAYKWAEGEVDKSVLADVAKRKISAAKRRELADKGWALSDGSYPIENEGDLHNAAILARSGHGDVGAAKKLIAKRAKELGVPNPLSDKDGKDAEPEITKTSEPDDGQPQGTDETVTADLIKTAVAEAVKPYEGLTEKFADTTSKLASVEAELAKIKATPIPGGPFVLAPESEVTNVAAKQQELNKYEALVLQVSDPDLKKVYRQRADKLREELAA